MSTLISGFTESVQRIAWIWLLELFKLAFHASSPVEFGNLDLEISNFPVLLFSRNGLQSNERPVNGKPFRREASLDRFGKSSAA